MKQLYLLLGFGLSLGPSLYGAAEPVEVAAPVDKIYIPASFDDNDNVEVVLHGVFPDSCHSVGNVEADIDPLSRRILITATSFVDPNQVCVLSVTPFIQSVKLGLLPEGSYNLVYEANREVKKGLDIARRKTESPDDFLYATVENASIEVNAETGKQALKLQGHFPYFFFGCMVIKEVRTSRSEADVLLVQPIAEIVDTDICDQQPLDKSFDYTSGLQEPFIGEGLLHVRTLNGNSLNRILNIK